MMTDAQADLIRKVEGLNPSFVYKKSALDITKISLQWQWQLALHEILDIIFLCNTWQMRWN